MAKEVKMVKEAISFACGNVFSRESFCLGQRQLSLFLHPLQLCLFHLSTPPSTQQPHRQGHLARGQHLTFDIWLLCHVNLYEEKEYVGWAASIILVCWCCQISRPKWLNWIAISSQTLPPLMKGISRGSWASRPCWRWGRSRGRGRGTSGPSWPSPSSHLACSGKKIKDSSENCRVHLWLLLLFSPPLVLVSVVAIRRGKVVQGNLQNRKWFANCNWSLLKVKLNNQLCRISGYHCGWWYTEGGDYHRRWQCSTGGDALRVVMHRRCRDAKNGRSCKYICVISTVGAL